MNPTAPRIGLIVPSGNAVVERDLGDLFRGSASVHAARMDAGALCTPAAHERMNEGIDLAARQISAIRPAEVAYACTSGGFERGLDGDREIVSRVAAITRAPAQSATGAIITALGVVSARRVAVVSPYLPELGEQLSGLLRSLGHEVIGTVSLGLERNDDIGAQSPEDIAAFALAAAPAEADTLVLPCTNWRVVEAIPIIEASSRAVVVSSNSALAAGLVVRGIAPAVSSPSRLLGAALQRKDHP